MYPCNRLYWRILIFLLFLIHIVYAILRPNRSSTFSSSGLFVWVPHVSILRRVGSILQEVLPRCFFFWWDFNAWFREAFSFVWGTFFLISLFHLHLFDCICFEFSLVLVILLFSDRSDFFLTWQFYSFLYSSFSTFPSEHSVFFYAKFHSFILTVNDIRCLRVESLLWSLFVHLKLD